MNEALIEFLEAQGVEFDCQAETGWYWFGKNGFSDDMTFMTKEDAAKGAALTFGWDRIVVDAVFVENGKYVILFAGTRHNCLKFMRNYARRCEMIFTQSGRLATGEVIL